MPLDVLKIKRQTNPEAFRGRGVFRIVADEGMGLYRGAGWTAARNAPGSFAVSPMIISWCPHKITRLNRFSVVRRFRIRQRIHLQIDRLQLSHLVPKLHRLYCRRIRLSCRLSPPRCHQNTHSKSEFRKPGERIQDLK